MVDTNQLPKKYVKTGNHGKLILNPEYKAWMNGESTIDADGHNNNNNHHANDTFNDEKNETISEQIRKQLEQLNLIKDLLTSGEYATRRQAILDLLDTSIPAATTTIPEAIAYAIPPTVYEQDANIICDFEELMLDIVGTYNIVSFNVVSVLGDPPMTWKEGHVNTKIDGDTLVTTSSITLMIAGIEKILLTSSCLEVENAQDKTTKSIDHEGQVATGKWTTIGPKHRVLVENESNGSITTSEFEGNNITATMIYPDKPGLGGTIKLLKTTEEDGKNDPPGGLGGTLKLLKTTEEDGKNDPPVRIISLKSGSDQDIAEALQKLGCDDSSTAETETKNHPTVNEHDANIIWDFKELMLDIVGTYNIVSCDCVMVQGDPPMLHPMIWKKGHQTYEIDKGMLVMTNTLFLMIEGIEQIHVSAVCFEVENAQDKTTKSTGIGGEVSTGQWTTIGPKHHVLFEKEPTTQRPTPEVWVKRKNGVFNNPRNLNYELKQFGIGVGIATTEFEGNNITTTIIYPDKPGLCGTIKLLKTTEEDGKNDPPGGLGGTLKLLKTTKQKGKRWWKKEKK